jgi:sugar diacid utilization regulator
MNNKGLSNLDREIIMAFAKYDMKPYRVSENIFLAKGTVMYHIKKIKKITGLDVRKFYELCELLEVMDEY